MNKKRLVMFLENNSVKMELINVDMSFDFFEGKEILGFLTPVMSPHEYVVVKNWNKNEDTPYLFAHVDDALQNGWDIVAELH